MKAENTSREKSKKKRYEPPSVQTGRIFENVLSCGKLVGSRLTGCRMRPSLT